MSGWIKCSDRLPNVIPNIEVEDSHPNLLLCCKLDDGSLSIEQGWYSDLVEEDQPKFFTMWINNEWTYHNFRTDSPEVTHWMPLPKLPNDETSICIAEQLKALQSNPDKEAAHSQADKILCDLLNSLGYDDVVKEFENLEKWYA